MSTKESILKSSKELFAKKGYKGTSIRDICSDAGAAVSAIKYHFGSKEQLFIDIIEEFSQNQLDSTLTALNKPESLSVIRVRLELFMDSILLSLSNDPYSFRIIQREIETMNPLIDEVFQSKILKIIEALTNFFDEAKKKSIIKSNVNTLDLAGLFLNAISNQVKSDHINLKYYGRSIREKNYRKMWIDSILSILLDGTLDS